MTQFKRPATTLTRSDLGPEISFGKPAGGWRLQLFKVVFESDTRAGKIFDVVVIAAILLSVVAVMADSVTRLPRNSAALLQATQKGKLPTETPSGQDWIASIVNS